MNSDLPFWFPNLTICMGGAGVTPYPLQLCFYVNVHVVHAPQYAVVSGEATCMVVRANASSIYLQLVECGAQRHSFLL
jgi:hypothetical protein